MSFVRLTAACILVAGAAVAEQGRSPDYVSPAVYNAYDCNTLALMQEALRKEYVDAVETDVIVRYGDLAVTAPFMKDRPEDTGARLSQLEGHQIALDRNFDDRGCASRLAGGVGSGSAWAMSPERSKRFREQKQRPYDDGVTARAPGDRTVRPLPKGPDVAKPVRYSKTEIARYCEQGWDSRRLGDGTIEYNPCFYR